RLVEGPETVLLALGNLGAGGTATTLGNTANTTTISDNDTATISFQSATSSVGEAAGTDELTAVLTITAIGTTGTAQLNRSVSVNVSDAGTGTATGGGTDYTATTKTLTFAVGSA